MKPKSVILFILLSGALLIAIPIIGFAVYDVFAFQPRQAEIKALLAAASPDERNPSYILCKLVEASTDGHLSRFVARLLIRDLEIPQIFKGGLGWHATYALWNALVALHLSDDEKVAIMASRSYTGNNRWGFSTEAQARFERPLSELTMEELATIVILTKSPTRMNSNLELMAQQRNRLMSDASDLMSGIYTKLGGAIYTTLVWYYTLLLLLYIGGNTIVSILVLFLLFRNNNRKLSYRFLWLSIEVIYGLINPVVYLMTLQAFGTLRFLNAAGVYCLITYWSTRLWIPANSITSGVKNLVRSNILISMAVVIMFAVKDTIYLTRFVWGSEPGAKYFTDFFDIGYYFRGSLLLFYLIPLLILIVQLRKALSAVHWRKEPCYLLLSKSTSTIFIPVILLTASGLCLVPFLRHGRETDIQDKLLLYRSSIYESADRYNMDPGLIASLIYVNHRDSISPSRYRLEKLVMEIWLADYGSHLGLSETMNISIGLAQIKPITAITATIIPCWKTADSYCTYKYTRDVPHTIRDRWTFTPPITSEAPVALENLRKNILVSDLLTPEKNIEYCAYILSLYSLQWERTNPEWSIRNRPEVLATLYQIGFERSYPKAQPKANKFGIRVMDVYESEWMREIFPVNVGELSIP